MKHVVRPRAEDDILRQFRYYLLQDGALDVATRFLNAVDTSIASICKMPHMGAPKHLNNPTLSGLRFLAVKGFEDILIFYVVRPDALRVVRVLHGRRDINKILEREKDNETPN